MSRDPNAAEKARRAEKKADAEAGLRVIDTNKTEASVGTATSGGSISNAGSFKKGGFKSSFTAVKGPVASTAPTRKNVLGDEDVVGDGDQDLAKIGQRADAQSPVPTGVIQHDPEESDTDEESTHDTARGGYYDPRRPTDCGPECANTRIVEAASPML